jgi:hypothetical protein
MEAEPVVSTIILYLPDEKGKYALAPFVNSLTLSITFLEVSITALQSKTSIVVEP